MINLKPVWRFLLRPILVFIAFIVIAIEDILKKNLLNESSLLKRYDGIIHLETSKEFYTLENNKSRFHSFDESVEQSEKLGLVYSGFSNYHFIGTFEHFEDKLDSIYEKIIGINSHGSIPRLGIIKRLVSIS